jgi:hypothetical protein
MLHWTAATALNRNALTFTVSTIEFCEAPQICIVAASEEDGENGTGRKQFAGHPSAPLQVAPTQSVTGGDVICLSTLSAARTLRAITSIIFKHSRLTPG